MIEERELAALEPDRDADSAPFWDALADGVLLVSECERGHRSFPSIGSCPVCASADVRHVAVEGTGSIYSWIVAHIALDPAFAGDVPYTVVAVELDGGGRVLGRLHLADGEAASAGARVAFSPYRVGDTVLPGFVLA